MSIQETKVETGHKKINVRPQVRHNQVQDLHSVQVLSQVQNRRNARVLSQVHDLQPARATSFSAIIKTETEEILIIIAINVVVRLQVKEVIRQDLNKEVLVEVAEEEDNNTKILLYQKRG